jgi:hypothetical protein
MSATTLPGVSPDYRHATKSIAPGETLDIRGFATLKWYDIAAPHAPVPAEIGELARQCLVDEVAGGAIELEGLGFVILHRCGEGFYFLLACTWAGNNELWETVWAKNGDADPMFRPWPLARGHPRRSASGSSARYGTSSRRGAASSAPTGAPGTSMRTSRTPTPGLCEALAPATGVRRRQTSSETGFWPVARARRWRPQATSRAFEPCASCAPCP